MYRPTTILNWKCSSASVSDKALARRAMSVPRGRASSQVRLHPAAAAAPHSTVDGFLLVVHLYITASAALRSFPECLLVVHLSMHHCRCSPALVL